MCCVSVVLCVGRRESVPFRVVVLIPVITRIRGDILAVVLPAVVPLPDAILLPDVILLDIIRIITHADAHAATLAATLAVTLATTQIISSWPWTTSTTVA